MRLKWMWMRQTNIFSMTFKQKKKLENAKTLIFIDAKHVATNEKLKKTETERESSLQVANYAPRPYHDSLGFCHLKIESVVKISSLFYLLSMAQAIKWKTFSLFISFSKRAENFKARQWKLLQIFLSHQRNIRKLKSIYITTIIKMTETNERRMKSARTKQKKVTAMTTIAGTAAK